jgi:hypothetical protein
MFTAQRQPYHTLGVNPHQSPRILTPRRRRPPPPKPHIPPFLLNVLATALGTLLGTLAGTIIFFTIYND